MRTRAQHKKFERVQAAWKQEEHQCLGTKKHGLIGIATKLLRKISNKSRLTEKHIKNLISLTIDNGDEYYYEWAEKQGKIEYTHVCIDGYNELQITIDLCPVDSQNLFKVDSVFIIDRMYFE